MILCLGTTPTLQRTMTFERLTLDTVNRALSVEITPSGKSLNVARALHVLGEEVVATGFLGGETGQIIRDRLDAAWITHEFVPVGPPTRSCVTIIDQSKSVVTELVEESQAVEESCWDELRQIYASRVTSASAVVLSGSLPPGGPVDFYAECVKLAGNIPVIIDGRGKELLAALPHRPFAVKPNRAELATTRNEKLDTDEALKRAMRDLCHSGAGWTIITLGEKGALVTDGSKFWRISIPKIDHINTIGSGDCFAAGLAFGAVRKFDMIETLRLAAAASVANAITPLPGLIHLEDVKSITKSINIELEKD
jgi:tagatose 6-phosphate kinase